MEAARNLAQSWYDLSTRSTTEPGRSGFDLFQDFGRLPGREPDDATDVTNTGDNWSAWLRSIPVGALN